MHESRLDEEQPSKTIGGHDVTAGPIEEESRLVKFDIGTFVRCHRKLCQLIKPFIGCYDSFMYLTTWQHPSLTFAVMLVLVYLSIKHPAFLAVIPMVYSSIVLSLSGVRKLGSTATKESLLIMRKNKFRRKVDDVDLELKIAAMKRAREDLRDYIDICIEIQAVESTLCRHLETFYRICRWEEERLSKMFLIALLLACLFLFLFPGRYLITIGIVGIFTGNSYFQKASRQAFVKSHLMLEQLRNYMDIHFQNLHLYVLNIAGVKRSSKSWKGSPLADNDNNEQWFDAEQEMLTSDSESYEDDIEVEDDEDMPTTRRRAKLFSGLSVVTHLADYRKKQKRINSGNCASCDVSFSSLLKKRQYCRHCGDSFCSRCCSKRVKRAVFGATAPAAYEETVLVCKSCYGFLMNKTEERSTDIWYY